MNTQKLNNLCKSPIALTISAAIGLITLPAQAALLVSSSSDNSIKQYDDTTGAYIRDFVTSGSGGLLNPQGLTLGPDGNLYVSSSGTNSVKKYDGTTGNYVNDFVVSGSGTLYQPNGLTFGTDNNLYVANTIQSNSSESSAVIKYEGTTGNFISEVVNGTRDPFGSPSPYKDVAFDSNGDLYTTFFAFRQGSGSVEKYNPTTGEAIGGFSANARPFGLAISPNDDIYASDLSGAVFRQTTTGLVEAFIPNESELSFGTRDLAFGTNGNLLVVDSSTNSIKEFDDETGDFLGNFIASNSGGLSSPSYLTTANVPVPEPSSVLGIVATGGLFVGSALQRQRNNRKQQPLG